MATQIFCPMSFIHGIRTTGYHPLVTLGRFTRWYRLCSHFAIGFRPPCAYALLFVFRTPLNLPQSTFCVNSLAHWLGEAPFDDKHTPRDHLVTALVTIGEGYHNFHHQFPMDYRNAIKWYQYDPTKWFIWGCKQIGLASHLKVIISSL